MYSNAEIKPHNWGAGFNDTYMVSPTDPLFLRIGTAFLREQQKFYGTDHYYSADTFNENRPPTNDSSFLARSSEAVYRSMTLVDSLATWVMQGWLFFNDQDFWKEPQVKAVLGAVPDHRMIILDLYCDVSPVWKRTDAFYGKQWIWCSLHNFGGNSSLQGNVPLIATEPTRLIRDEKRGTLSGIGMTMEGTHHNPLYYDMMMEMLWRSDSPDLQRWLKEYGRRRYGRSNRKAETALDLLFKSVYARGGRIDIGGMLCARPNLAPRGEWVTPDIAYRPLDLVHAWELMVDCSDELGKTDGFRYDLVDVGRQVLSNLSTQIHMQLIEAFARKDPGEFHRARKLFIALLNDLDLLVGTREEFLLGKWIAQARAWGKTDSERSLMEWNARNQITLWGDRNSPLHEYARKEWSGLIGRFYLPRWERYLIELETAMRTGSQVNDSLFNEQIKIWEEKWTRSNDQYPSAPQGDPIDASRRLLTKYLPLARTLYATVPNLATGKPVIVSGGTEGEYLPEFAVDGRIDPSSRWSASPPPQWLQVDLGEVHTIDHIQVFPYWDGKRYYQYFVEVSPDGKQWETVTDMRTNTTPATILGHDHRFPKTRARHVKVTLTFNSANRAVHLVELRVFNAK
jgi:alpha-N-acetylglucosaminidase